MNKLRRLLGEAIKRSPKFAYLYRQYVWIRLRPKHKELKSFQKLWIIREHLEKKFPNRYDIICRVDMPTVLGVHIPFLPSFLTGLYPWGLYFWKTEGKRWWDNMVLNLGKLAKISVRWDQGQRQYVCLKIWLKNYPAKQQMKSSELFEFSHELISIAHNPEWQISKWWWGAGEYVPFLKLMSCNEPYRKLGKLIYWPTKAGGRRGLFGKDLTVEQKVAIFYKFTEQKDDYPNLRLVESNAYNSEMYIDAVLGHCRPLALRYKIHRCIDCHELHRPIIEFSYANWLRCEKCEHKYWEDGTELEEAAA